jgi:16S rRNA (guanine527-N7)-methyltransferase
LSADRLRRTLAPVLELLAADPASLSSVRDPDQAWHTHVLDSLSGLELLGSPRELADVGAGAGFPGLALAAALPGAHVDLIESVRRKCAFIERAIDVAALDNATAICARAEAWAAAPPPDGGRERYDAATSRAVGRLSTVAELASPLLREGGALVVWKGRRDADEEAELRRAAAGLAMTPEEIRPAGKSSGFEHRHLHLIRKTGPTPADLPRREGMAKKRPRGRA